MSSAEGYLHGYDAKEQGRLYDQARFLEARVFSGFDFSSCRHVLEVGCGVGAQTEILLRRFPTLRVTGIDLSPAQIARAEHHFEALPGFKSRARFLAGDAAQLQPGGAMDAARQSSGPFDGAYLCWVLEHVSNPLELLRNLKRALAPGSKICIAEVLNSTLFVHPHQPVLARYWQAYNEQQSALGGDPWVGAKLGDLLSRAGFSDIQVRPQMILEDCRDPASREALLAYWQNLLLSGSQSLLDHGMIESRLIDEFRLETETLRKDPQAIFFYSFMKAEARS